MFFLNRNNSKSPAPLVQIFPYSVGVFNHNIPMKRHVMTSSEITGLNLTNSGIFINERGCSVLWQVFVLTEGDVRENTTDYTEKWADRLEHMLVKHLRLCEINRLTMPLILKLPLLETKNFQIIYQIKLCLCYVNLNGQKIICRRL